MTDNAMSKKSENEPDATQIKQTVQRRSIAPADARLDLQYLNWGRRGHGLTPPRLTPRQGWIYACIHKGAPILQLGHQPVKLQAGQFIIVEPSCASAWSAAQTGSSELLTWLWITPPRCEECLPPLGGYRVFQLDRSARQKARQTHLLCRREIEHPDSLSKLQIEQARLQLELMLARSRLPKLPPPQNILRVQFAMRWLEQNLDESKPVSALSDYLQISQATLNRLFRMHLGVPVAVYHHILKMNHARDWLAAGHVAVKEVGLALGYRHPNDFSRAFKKFTGSSPSGC